MGSRVGYGLSQQNWLPASIGKVNSKTRTPINATLIVSFIILLTALALPIDTLANTTTYLLLIVFSLVNAALLRIKLGKGEQDEEGDGPLTTEVDDFYQVNIAIPFFGFLICILFLLGQTLSILLS